MQEYSNFEHQLECEGHILTVLHGSSMWPMVRCRKDPVLIRSLKNIGKTLAERGDIVAYRKDDRYVVHRVLKVEADHYVIRGDNCLAKEYVPHADIIGVVTHWWRDGKEHNTSELCYKIYVMTWLVIPPAVRRLLHLKLHIFF